MQLNLEYQEEFATKFTDQIVGAHLEIEKFSALIGLDGGAVDEEKYSSEMIATILSRISREAKMMQLAAEYQIPLRNILISFLTLKAGSTSSSRWDEIRRQIRPISSNARQACSSRKTILLLSYAFWIAY